MKFMTVALIAMIGVGCNVSQTAQETHCETTTSVATVPTYTGQACQECSANEDCIQPVSECSYVTCIDGVCLPQKSSPEQTCQSTRHCSEGACCFTCINDQGSDLGELDVFDGPCMPGDDDHACGFGGGLCQDCTLQQMTCVSGKCQSLK